MVKAQVVFQPNTSDWNPHRNGAQGLKASEVITYLCLLSRLLLSYCLFQVKIASVAYDASSGETHTVFKPSKVQKRKHQINSLAYSAAERELELMEKKGQSLKTKAQTQAKYGW